MSRVGIETSRELSGGAHYESIVRKAELEERADAVSQIPCCEADTGKGAAIEFWVYAE